MYGGLFDLDKKIERRGILEKEINDVDFWNRVDKDSVLKEYNSLNSQINGVKSIYNIEMKNKGTPIGNRNKEEFKEYYDKIWKDIDFHV